MKIKVQFISIQKKLSFNFRHFHSRVLISDKPWNQYTVFFLLIQCKELLGTAGTSLQLALSPVHSNFKSVFASKL